jgi:hypothetical protein
MTRNKLIAKHFMIAFIIVISLALSCPALGFTEWIVNTGVPTSGTGFIPNDAPQYFHPGFHQLGFDGAGPLTGPDFWLAARFTIDAPYLIESLEAYLCNGCLSSGNGESDFMRYTLYKGIALPNITDAHLLDQTFDFPQDDVVGWKGLYGLDLVLEPGTYWMALEPNIPVGAGLIYDVPEPMDQYAQMGWPEDQNFTYEAVSFGRQTPYGDYNFGFGVRIAGQVVPEPVSSILLLVGGGAMCLRQRYQTKGPYRRYG